MISLLTPTHRRPERLRQMVESVRATATNVEICAICDSEDLDTIATLEELSGDAQIPVIHNHRPLYTKSEPWNRAARWASGDILMMCADDVIFRTPNWDGMIEFAFAECPDKILMVYGDDGGPNGKTFSTFPAISRKWMEITGYFTHPAFPGEWTDAWLFDVATMIGRVKYLPFVSEHMHWLWNKAEKDHTYQIAEEIRLRTKPWELYRELQPQRESDAEKLRKAML